MKNFILTFAVALCATAGWAQEKAAPRSEYTVELSAASLTVAPGTTESVTLSLNRSKSFAKSTASFGLMSGLPEGITVTFEPAEGHINETTAHIAVAANTKPGSYLLVLKTTIQNKNKGSMLKLLVVENGETVSMN